MRIKYVIRDIKNWFFIKKQIKKFKNTIEWKKYNLTHDWFYRIGCVINMRAEDFGESEDIHKVRFLDFAKDAFQYVGDTMELGELLFPEKYRIPDTNSYLVIFHQIMLGLSLKYIISRLILIGSLISIISFNFEYIKYIFLLITRNLL